MSVCTGCKEPTSRARVVVGGRVYCGDCVYEMEKGPVEHQAPPVLPRHRSVRLQEERLPFPLPPSRKERGA
jgi:hypothetical protein